ncbi:MULTISPECIES: YqjD family protein [Chromobacterium]|uniref:DUF883 family protein n=1 Tax=Chromobacterium TaxID=535 RepID=UPI000653C26E|nr:MULTISPECIES: DUF883 family protein [Chromobacterium]KMN79962.1 membrane protein [Chromobacterium sp. LK11]MBN3005561.1 DUF883 domain-containing protein [Chromobacterium alkanivorans]MCP1292222.1 DUF883 family protein [Chromobacterium sp. S0633]MCS3806346.1 ElaB/YqjD/DUF883 family membrane-anchored ribosome-binding protein [Chromobacterium alkanivorans]MCS3820642.1 ElaB/YqjD/DUF883 family membrane-anchored ribosome-binding protein [Chromobacterium alkanivorans]
MSNAAAIAKEKEQLLDDVRQVLVSTEELIDASLDDGSQKSKEIRQRVNEKLKLAKAKLLDAEQVVVGKAKVAAKATDQYVHENPWKSIGIAAGVAFLLGMLVSRR